MKSTFWLLSAALMTVTLASPSPIRAEEAEGQEEAPAQGSDDSPATTTTSTEAGAPAMDEPAPKPVFRRQRAARPRAIPRNPDTGGGGGGGGGGSQRERPDGDEPESNPGGAPDSWEPETPQGKPANNVCDMPPLRKINVHLMGGNGNRFKVDSTPIVCSTDKGTRHERYCQETMRDNNRLCCPVKPEGHPMRVTCELILLGKDPSDGIAGPSWRYIGSDGGVERHPDNPFLAFAYGKGIVRACSNVVKVCGETTFQVPNYGKK